MPVLNDLRGAQLGEHAHGDEKHGIELFFQYNSTVIEVGVMNLDFDFGSTI